MSQNHLEDEMSLTPTQRKILSNTSAKYVPAGEVREATGMNAGPFVRCYQSLEARKFIDTKLRKSDSVLLMKRTKDGYRAHQEDAKKR
jgi:hypothetical protein